jgi:esterase/lipase superfamily enzyme
LTLERTILQRMTVEAADRAAVARRVCELMEGLRLVGSISAGPDTLESLDFDKSITPRGAGDEVYPVWFGINRQPAAGGGFTGERDDRVTLGRVEVFVPEAHRFGETGNAFWRRLLRFDLRDDRLRLQRVQNQDRDGFYSEIHQAMSAARESGETPHALVFLHGFNVTFADAAIRAAQIGYDLKVPGATAFFSWPSRGSVAAYPADEASIEASEQPITDFLMVSM